MKTLLFPLLFLLTLSWPSATGLLGAPSIAADPFASHVTGDWVGSGIYDGNKLTLTRSWTVELGGQFLRGDMRVSMPNGASFGAFTYWKLSGDGAYEFVWLDGMGRIQTLQAIRDSDSGVIRSEFVDELAEGGRETRRWEFERTGPDAYVERLFRKSGERWELLTEWSFKRVVNR